MRGGGGGAGAAAEVADGAGRRSGGGVRLRSVSSMRGEGGRVPNRQKLAKAS